MNDHALLLPRTQPRQVRKQSHTTVAVIVVEIHLVHLKLGTEMKDMAR